MEKAELINLVKTERRKWDELLSQVDRGLMNQPGVEGDWSVKDILAHVMWYEREMIGLLGQRELAGSDLWGLPLDERNAGVYEETKDLRLEEVITQSKEIYTEFLKQLEALPEEAYNDASCFAGMPSEWEPWDVIAGNSFRHYPEHTESVQGMLRSQQG